MMSISQIAELTGTSVRTLQYYDEIDLLKPSQLTESGYRLYDEESLTRLQQILFFKELDFKLKDIREILAHPNFNRIEAFHKQKELLMLKQKRIDRLIKLLEKLEKGEQHMSFKAFDLSEYIEALEQFKANNTIEIIKHWGGLAQFDQFVQNIKINESNVAQIAIQQFGSVEKYTEAMKYNLDHFSEIMAQFDTLMTNKEDLLNRSDALYRSLTADLTKDVTSEQIQSIVKQIICFSQETTLGLDMGEGYWDMVIESYSDETVRKVTDQNYGTGSSDYIAKAFKYYWKK